MNTRSMQVCIYISHLILKWAMLPWVIRRRKRGVAARRAYVPNAIAIK